MKAHKNSKKSILTSCCLMLAAASSFANISIIDAVSNAISGKTDTSAVLEAFAKNTALATHTNLADSAVKLDKAVAEFVLKPTESNLGEVARLWRQTRQYWEQSEAFNSGPPPLRGSTRSSTHGLWTPPKLRSS